MHDEPTYYDIEAYRNKPPPSDIDEFSDQVCEFGRLGQAFPEYFPGRFTDEELVRILEEGKTRRGVKKTLRNKVDVRELGAT